MTRHSQSNSGRIEDQGRGIGVNSREDVEQRAREIAKIAGRSEPSVADRAQAKAELLDQTLPSTVSEDDEVSILCCFDGLGDE